METHLEVLGLFFLHLEKYPAAPVEKFPKQETRAFKNRGVTNESG